MWFVQRYAKRHALEKGLVPRKGLVSACWLPLWGHGDGTRVSRGSQEKAYLANNVRASLYSELEVSIVLPAPEDNDTVEVLEIGHCHLYSELLVYQGHHALNTSWSAE